MAKFECLNETLNETMEWVCPSCFILTACIFMFSIVIYYPIVIITLFIFDFTPDHGSIAAKIFEGLLGFPIGSFFFMLVLSIITLIMALVGVINFLGFVSGITLLRWGAVSKSILLCCLGVSLIFIRPLLFLFDSVYDDIKNAINSRKNK